MNNSVQVKLPYYGNWTTYIGLTHVQAVKEFVAVNQGVMRLIVVDRDPVVWSRFTDRPDHTFEHIVKIRTVIDVIPKRGD